MDIVQFLLKMMDIFLFFLKKDANFIKEIAGPSLKLAIERLKQYFRRKRAVLSFKGCGTKVENGKNKKLCLL